MKPVLLVQISFCVASTILLTACAQNSRAIAEAAPQTAAPQTVAPMQTQIRPTPVKLTVTAQGAQLTRGGKPYLIKGAGGDGDLARLAARGGNSIRTWGADNLGARLDEAQKLGMSVTVGLWLGHTEHGFSYDDPKQVAAQFEAAKAAIDKYKDHPAVLMWGIGNEMEGYAPTTDPKMWAAVQQIAAYAHQVDPNHPTMTVIAEIGGDKIPALNKNCPDIDIVGINSYGGAPSIPQRYKEAGGVKPYVLTEFGPAGTWEVGKNSWGAAPELTSSAKAEAYATAWNKAIAGQPLALGGYAFTWGNKQEATATWFGMLLPDGETLGAADAMAQIWTGKPAPERAPVIGELKLTGAPKVAPGAGVNAELKVGDPDGDPVKVEWVLQADPMVAGGNGDAEAIPPTFPEAIVKSSNSGAQIVMPQIGGAYRLFAYARDGKGSAAVGNIPLFVEGGNQAPKAEVRKATLPLELTGEDGKEPYYPSGYMGNAGAIAMESSTDNPHTGKSALKIEYKAADNWGGVVWQSPVNDWGELPGGWNLEGAKNLSFWARGAKGGEKVAFGFGLLDRDKKFYDTGLGKTEVTLSPDWKEFHISLADKDLSRIKTGFYWTAAATGAPFTFYLDDVKYE